MNDRLRENIMRLIAVTAVFSFVYPGIALLKCAVYKANTDLLDLMFALLITFAGFFAGKVIMREDSKALQKLVNMPFMRFIFWKKDSIPLLTKLLAHLSIILPVLASIAVRSGSGPKIQIIEALSALILYCIGLRANFRGFDSIIGNTGFYMGLLFTMVFIFISTYFNSFNHLRGQLALLAFVSVLASLIIRNQASLDAMVMKKEAHSASIPRNIRSFNIKIVIIFLLIMIMLLNLNSIIVFILKTVKLIIIAFLRWFARLLGQIFPETDIRPDVGNPGVTYPFSGNESVENPLQEFIYSVLKKFLLLYLTYKAVPVIILKIGQGVRWIIQLVKRLLTGRLTRAEGNRESDYIDEIETIKPSWFEKKRNAGSSAFRRKRSLKGITDPVQKIRFFYGYVMEILVLRGIGIKKSDTTGEILDKSQEIKEMGIYFNRLTRIYDSVRYGGIIPDHSEVLKAEGDFYKISDAAKSRKGPH